MFAPLVKAPAKQDASRSAATRQNQVPRTGYDLLAEKFDGGRPEAGPQWDIGRISIFPPGEQPSAPPLCLQPKLLIGAVNDPLEQEADLVAEQVMRTAAPGVALTTASARVSRKCAVCEEEEKAQQLQTKPAGLVRSGGEAPPIVHQVLRSPGQPLDVETRAYFEPRFGQDFSRVRVHTGAAAEQSARNLNAHAYTVGHNVVFNTGRFAPSTYEGRHLISHELAHVVQQRGGGELRVQRKFEGCQSLLKDDSGLDLTQGVGNTVHRLVSAHFRRTVADAARGEFPIPGATADPQRAAGGLCGRTKPSIAPQKFGKMNPRAGAGFPDLARIGSGGVLQVAELKPAALECLIDGEDQVFRYINHGNAQDEPQKDWRASLGVKVVSPMLESAYPPPTLSFPVGPLTLELKTAWCIPGLLAYKVKVWGEKEKQQEQDQPQPRPPIIIEKPGKPTGESESTSETEGEGKGNGEPGKTNGEPEPGRPGRRPGRPFDQPSVEISKTAAAIIIALATVGALIARAWKPGALAFALGRLLGSFLARLGFGLLVAGGTAAANTTDEPGGKGSGTTTVIPVPVPVPGKGGGETSSRERGDDPQRRKKSTTERSVSPPPAAVKRTKIDVIEGLNLDTLSKGMVVPVNLTDMKQRHGVAILQVLTVNKEGRNTTVEFKALQSRMGGRDEPATRQKSGSEFYTVTHPARDLGDDGPKLVGTLVKIGADPSWFANYLENIANDLDTAGRTAEAGEVRAEVERIRRHAKTAKS